MNKRTGFKRLDADLGGLEEGRAYLVRGASGSGKTILGLQFVVNGLEEDDPVVYISLEPPKDLLFYGQLMGWDLVEAVRKKQLILLEYPEDFEEFGRPGSDMNWGDVIEDMAEYLKENQSRRLVIDPVNPLYLFARTDAPTQYARSLLARLGELKVTSLLMEDTAFKPSLTDFSAALEPFLSGVFELQFHGPDARRQLWIKKIRGRGIPQAEYPFEIRYKEGLVSVSARKESDGRPEDEGNFPAFFVHRLSRELRRMKRLNQPLTVLIFSLSNSVKPSPGDSYGRGLYEELIKEIIRLCRVNSREFDTVARYSEEKLIAILPGTDKSGGTLYAEKIRNALPNGEMVIRVGSSSYPTDAQDEDDLVQRAFASLPPSSRD